MSAVDVPLSVRLLCERQRIAIRQECDGAWEFTAPDGKVFSTEARTRIIVAETAADWKTVPNMLGLFSLPPKDGAVNVLAVMRRDARGFEDLNFLHPSRPVFRQQSDEAIAAVAELQKRLAISVRGQRIAIAMLRGERRKDRAEIDAMAENVDLAAAAFARCKGEGS